MLDYLDGLLFGTGPIEVVQTLFGTGHPRPFEIASLLGDTWGLMLVLGVAMWFWGRKTTYALLGLIALGAVSKEAMSNLFSVARPSPGPIEVYKHLEVKSFPSGHVYQTFAPWLFLSLRASLPYSIPFTVALVIGVARLYLGVHFLGDVVFAVIFGIVLVLAYIAVYPHAEPWLSRRSMWFFLGIAVLAIGGVILSMLIRLNNPRRWEILGLVAGAAIGLFLEYRYVRYRAARKEVRPAAAVFGVGAGGIVICLVVDRLFAPDAFTPGLFTAGAAMIWVFAGAPALFQRLGWATPD